MLIRALILSGTLFISSLATAESICAPYKLNKAYSNENAKFEAFLDIIWKQTMKDSPEWASDLGYKEYADKWSDESLEAIEKRKKKLDCVQNLFKTIRRSRLKPFHQLNYDLYKDKVELSLAGRKFDGHYLVLNQLGGVHMDIIDVLMSMPDTTPVDVENKLKRLEKASVLVAQHKKLLQEGLKRGVTAPHVVLSKVLAQFDSILTAKVEDSALYLPFKNIKGFSGDKVSLWQDKAKLLITNQLYPVLQDFKKFLTEDYIPNSRKTISIQDLPQGKEWYEWSIRRQTTTKMTADEIHQIGLQEVERLTSVMNEIRQKVGFKKDLKEFNKFLLTDSRFYYKKPEELIAGYRDIAKRADAELPKLFKTLPRLTYGVRAIPAFKAPASPTAYYQSGSLETGRAGYFEANTHDLKARPIWAMEALTLHEAVPGHHLQIALTQELGEMPEFRKRGGYTAFIEGWGLYAESLGERMGFYQDPYSKYGQLTYEMWRAIRLVVDTGIHSKGWSRDQALKYFKDNLAKSDSEIEVEVDRYIVWPGQALAYKIGQMKLLELRKKAENKMKDKFDIRDYHEVVLQGGALPLNILESRVEKWIQKMN